MGQQPTDDASLIRTMAGAMGSGPTQRKPPDYEVRPSGDQHCVHRTSDGSKVKCHPTLAAATDHIAQLTSVTKEARMPATTTQQLSPSYVQAALEALRRVLSPKQQKQVHQAALPSSGGKARAARLRALAQQLAAEAEDAGEGEQQPATQQQPTAAAVAKAEVALELLEALIEDVTPAAAVAKAEITFEGDSQVWVAKADGELQGLVYGVVLQPGVRDSQGDEIDADEIAKAAHGWMRRSRTLGDQHPKIHKAESLGFGAELAEPVESYIAPADFTIERNDGTRATVLKGSWVMATHVASPKLLDLVVKGERTGFSIGGSGVREED